MKLLCADFGFNEPALMILDGHFHSAGETERGTTAFAAVPHKTEPGGIEEPLIDVLGR